MDYARFNYVAQPEDKGVALMPDIGPYDKYAISWGYRPILGKTAEEEKPILDSWILAKAGDPLYRFGHQQAGGVVDPSSQTEDLGDDAMKASMYGIKNLKRIVPNLEKWTTKKGETYEEMATMYGQVQGQFNRYMGHVAANIGGVYEYYKTADQNGAVYTHVNKDKQREALKFINDQLFDTPEWMIDKNIYDKIQFSGSIENIGDLQARALNNILDAGRMSRMIENETLNGNDAYKLTTMFYDLRQGVWSELYRGGAIDTYRRNLQRAHINRLAYLLNDAKSQRGANSGYFKQSVVDIDQSDIRAMVRGELNRLKRDIRANVSRTSDTTTKYHLEDAIARIDMALDPK